MKWGRWHHPNVVVCRFCFLSIQGFPDWWRIQNLTNMIINDTKEENTMTLSLAHDVIACRKHGQRSPRWCSKTNDTHDDTGISGTCPFLNTTPASRSVCLKSRTPKHFLEIVDFSISPNGRASRICLSTHPSVEKSPKTITTRHGLWVRAGPLKLLRTCGSLGDVVESVQSIAALELYYYFFLYL